MSNKIFLGGSIFGGWREQIIPMLAGIDYFNPIVENWTEECKAIEKDEKDNKCNIHLYIINNQMTGVFSFAEAIHSAHTGKNVIFQVCPEGYTKSQLSSLKSVCDLIKEIGGHAFFSDDIKVSASLLQMFKFF